MKSPSQDKTSGQSKCLKKPTINLSAGEKASVEPGRGGKNPGGRDGFDGTDRNRSGTCDKTSQDTR